MSFETRTMSLDYFKNLGLDYSMISDSLTGAVTRKYLLDYVTFLTMTKKKYSLIVSDIDNFKAFNDKYDHPVGDEVIKRMINVILANVPENALVGRYSGDKFAVLVPEMEAYDEKWNALNRIHTATRNPIKVGDNEYRLTMTSGCATYPADGATATEIVEKIGKTLYRGKDKGGNCYIIYNDALHHDLKFRAAMPFSEKMLKMKKAFNDANGFRYQVYEALINTLDMINTDGIGFFSKNALPLIYNGNLSVHLKCMDMNELNNYYSDGVIKITSKSETPEHGYLYKYMTANQIKAVLITQVALGEKNYGYLMLYSTHNRIWQDSDISIMLYAADLIAFNVERKKEN